MKSEIHDNAATVIGKDNANRDHLTGVPGAHPVGVTLGAAGGAAGGAAVGAVLGGPVGAAVGAIAGAIGGGLAGKGYAEIIHPTAEHAYWRHHFRHRPYYVAGTDYEDYAHAYECGWQAYLHHGAAGKSFEEHEPELLHDWQQRAVNSRLTWEHARPAAYEAWMRMKIASIGDPSGPLPDAL